MCVPENLLIQSLVSLNRKASPSGYKSGDKFFFLNIIIKLNIPKGEVFFLDMRFPHELDFNIKWILIYLFTAGGLDWMIFKGSFQPKSLCDSMIL